MRISDSVSGAKGSAQSGHQAETMAAALRCFVWDAPGNGSGGVAPTITGGHNANISDYTAIVVHPKTTGALCANSHPGSYTGQDAFNDMLPVVPADPPRKYIVRRLTPLECCRLQGFPDCWEDGVQGSDSARYKMWGNGIALPCAVDVLRRIAKAMEVPMEVRPIDANALEERMDKALMPGADFIRESYTASVVGAVIKDTPTLSLNTLRDEIYQDAVAHGLWEKSDRLAKEAAEDDDLPGEKSFIEKFFKWHEAAQLIFFEGDEMLSAVEEYNWDSATEELADVVIMAMSAAGYLGIDIDAAIRRKMAVNKERPWKHGKE